jgi:Xaa-Pro aminopeptidase
VSGFGAGGGAGSSAGRSGSGSGHLGVERRQSGGDGRGAAGGGSFGGDVDIDVTAFGGLTGPDGGEATFTWNDVDRNGEYTTGDAFTIEPGIYISTRSLDMLPDTPKNRAFIARVKATVLRYQNTGVRIEDDYIITERGLERISLVPREIDEIEALMKRRRAITP